MNPKTLCEFNSGLPNRSFGGNHVNAIMSAKYQIHDAHDLQMHVHFALSRSPYLARLNVQFQIDEQDVILRGSVKTYYQKQMAQESLRRVSGIRSIVNQLNVAVK